VYESSHNSIKERAWIVAIPGGKRLDGSAITYSDRFESIN